MASTTTVVTHPDGTKIECTTAGGGAVGAKGLRPAFEAKLDAVCENMVSNGTCAIPGVVVMARRGADTYHKSFGFADKEKGTPMELDAQFRCFSMTKVFAAAVGLMFKEKGLLDLEAPVSDYLPAFDREFTVLSEAPDYAAADEVPYTSYLTGETHSLKYTKAPAVNTMLVKHCMAESSGISYDFFSDVELWLKAPLFGKEYAIANALRRQKGNGSHYTSNTIIGQDSTLAEYVDAIAAAGYLTCEPGAMSYGLGALVIGRIIEVAHEKETGSFKRFSAIVAERLFRPLSMDSAAFFLDDGMDDTCIGCH